MGRDHPHGVAVPSGLFAGEAAAIADGPVVGEPVEIEALDVRMAHLVTADHRAVEELDGDVVGRQRPEMDLRDHLPFLPEIDLGQEREVVAEVHLGSLTTDDVAVELLHGPVVGGDEMSHTHVQRLDLDGFADDGAIRYRGRFACEQAGRYGYTVRVVPSHDDLAVPVEMNCVSWA